MMRIWSNGLRNTKISIDKFEVLEDVRRAQRELSVAQWRFQDALDQDQIDYAIYSLEAAEKKLDMLLRKAKAIWSVEPREEMSREGIG
jgi:hypothetical protein